MLTLFFLFHYICMETLYELKDITLLPSVKNNGHLTGEIYSVIDKDDNTESYPIFTAPMEAIVGKETVKSYIDHGIRPILPLTEPINLRLEWCQWIFCAFSLSEVKQHFLIQDKRSSRTQFHVCIDAGNGHDIEMLDICKKIKQLYSNQVLVMGGNIGVPEAYVEYCKAGFDYIRVGLNSGSLINRHKYGFHYPMASLLMGIKNIKTSTAVGLPKLTKIIADGGIEQPSDIMKAIALGADYVMIGREFARVLEAQGVVYKKTKVNGKASMEEVNPDTLIGMSGFNARNNCLRRQYFGNTCEETRAKRAGFQSVEDWKKTRPSVRVIDSSWEWIDIDCNLAEWTTDFQMCVYYGFMMTGSKNWLDYQKNVRYGSVLPEVE